MWVFKANQRHELTLTIDEANDERLKLSRVTRGDESKEYSQLFNNMVLSRRAKNIERISVGSKQFESNDWSAPFWLGQLRLWIVDEIMGQRMEIQAYVCHQEEKKKAGSFAYFSIFREIERAKFYINLVSVTSIGERFTSVFSIGEQ